jgi:KDO2-lipid IV(A) lauroyltransferase
MQRPHKTRERRKTADLEDRQPLKRIPLWLRALAALPLPVLYVIADFFAWLAEYVVRHRRTLIDAQLRNCFPDKDQAWIDATRRSFYRNFGDVSVEIIKTVSISEAEIRRRVRFVDAAPARAILDSGQSVVVVSSHNCNWEWILLALSVGMGHPLVVAYKPLVDRWGDRLFLATRSRFGARMIPARRVLMHVLRHRGQARVIAMATDQNPEASSVHCITKFFGQDTAFYMGPDVIARSGKMAVYYLAMRREARGHYSLTFEPLAAAGEELAEGAIIDRYARRVEALTREHPGDWVWSYRRWKTLRQGTTGDAAAKARLGSGSG